METALLLFATSYSLQVKTLKDYLPESKRNKLVNPEWVGMIEQVVAANGRVFVGTYWSTFTSFIVRMRGYQVCPAVILEGCLHQSVKPFIKLTLRPFVCLLD